jgi:Amt family ammonium transporter
MFGDAALGIDYYGAAYSIWTDFLFQAMFAATAATIVSGAVAGRIKLGSFFLFSLIFVGIVYPILGSWKWGGGWLDAKGFYDFAGSTLVHSVGGWAALAGAITLGPRIGKYVDGVSKAIPGHNMPLVTIGVFLLWLGWFGFNGGSALCGDADYVSFVMVTTALAAAAGIVGSGICSVIVQKKPDLTMVLNGALAGLVGITAGADVLTPANAIFIGLVTGAVVVLSVIALDKAKIDDPVGAISVHLVCGIIGTLAVALNSDFSFGVQLIGVLSYGAVAFIAALIIFSILKATIGIRVSEEEEVKGLDVSEHSMEAYSGL